MFNRPIASSARQARALEARAAVSRRFTIAARTLPAAPLDFSRYQEWVLLPEPAELDSLNTAAYTAEGRAEEIRALWQATLATAICARRVAEAFAVDPSTCIAASLLHRIGDALALTALARSEDEAGVRLDAPSRTDLCASESNAIGERAMRWWSVPPNVASIVIGWRRFGEFATNDRSAATVYLADLLATEWLVPEICAPGLIDSVAGELGLSHARAAELRPGAAQRALLQSLIR
jgi:HDOD domain